jgi:hypothetical protein
MPGSKNRAVGKPTPPSKIYTAPRLPPGKATTTPHDKKTRKVVRRAERREVAMDGPDGNELILWGEQWIAGKIQYTYSPPDIPSQLWLVYELQAGADSMGGECDGFIDYVFTDTRVPAAGTYATWWYPGTAAGEVCAALAAVDPTWNEAFPGTCYGVMVLEGWGGYWKDKPAGLWHYRAKKCLLPETLTFSWTTNAWDQFYSYMRFQRGKALAAGEIHTNTWIAAKAAAAAAGRTHTAHMGIFGDEADPDDVIEMLRLLTDSWCFPDEEGRYLVIPDLPGDPTITITESHRAKSVPTVVEHAADVRERPNTVTMWYTDIANGRQLVPKTVKTPAAAAGLVKEIPVEYKVPAIYDPAVVDERLAYNLNSHQFDLRLRERWNAKAEDVAIGTIADRFLAKRGDRHFVSRLLLKGKNANNTVDVLLLQHDNDKFSADVVAVPPKVSSTLANSREAPPNIDVGSIAWLEEVALPARASRGILTYEIPEGFSYADGVEVFVAFNGGPQRHWFSSSSSPAVTPTLTELGAYTITLKVRHRITYQLSTGTSIDVVVQGKTSPPLRPVMVAAVQLGTRVQIYWQPPADSSIVGYEVRRGTSGQTFAEMTRVGRVDTREHFDEPPVGSWRYGVASIDWARNVSDAEFCDVQVFWDGPDATGEIGVAWFDRLVPGFDGPFYYGDTVFLAQSNRLATPMDGLYMEGLLTGKRVIYLYTGGEVGGNDNVGVPTVARADAVMAAGGYACIDDYEAGYAIPRRGGQGLWAPITLVDSDGLPDLNGGAIANASQGRVIGGDGFRNTEFKFRTISPTRVGDPAGATTAGAVNYSGLISQRSPIRFGQAGGAFNLGVFIATNSPYAQEYFVDANGEFFKHSSRQAAIPLGDYDITSVLNGAGTEAYAQLQIPLTKQLQPGQVLSLSWMVTNGMAAFVDVISLSNASATLRTRDKDGNPFAGVGLRVTVMDTGRGGATYENFL